MLLSQLEVMKFSTNTTFFLQIRSQEFCNERRATTTTRTRHTIRLTRMFNIAKLAWRVNANVRHTQAQMQDIGMNTINSIIAKIQGYLDSFLLVKHALTSLEKERITLEPSLKTNLP